MSSLPKLPPLSKVAEKQVDPEVERALRLALAALASPMVQHRLKSLIWDVLESFHVANRKPEGERRKDSAP
jgi:hypothetical protein